MDKKMVSIKGLDKAAVLAVLYNRATTGGVGFMQYDPTSMTVEQARKILHQFEKKTKKFLFWEIEVRPAEKYIYFDYLGGRAMKVDLTSDEEFDASEYDLPCYNGEEAAENVINSLREAGDVNPSTTQVAHRTSVLVAAKETRSRLDLNDVADVLGPKIDETERRLSTKVADSE